MPPEVCLMHPSGVTRHLVSGTAITFGKTFRRGEKLCHLSVLRLLLADDSEFLGSLIFSFRPG